MVFFRSVTTTKYGQIKQFSFHRTSAVILEFFIYGGDGTSEWYENYHVCVFRESREYV